MRTLWRAVAIALMVGVALACAPGVDDGLAARLGGAAEALPLMLRWGLSDAVPLPKKVVLWTLAPLVVWLAVAAGMESRRTGWRPGMLALALAWLGVFAASTATSIVPALSWEPLAVQVAVVSVAMASAWGVGRMAMLSVLRWTCGAGVAVAGYALCQHLGWDPLAWSPPELVRERSIGTLGNPNFLAAWLAVLAPLCAMQAAACATWRGRVAWGVGSAVVLAAIVFSYTRGAWVALLLEGVVLAAVVRPWRTGPRDGLAALLVASVILVATLPAVFPRPASISLGERALNTVRPTDASSVARVALWRDAIAIAADRPLTGAGPGTFTFAAMPFREHEPGWLLARLAVPGDPHNELLGVLAECGFPAAVLLVAIAGWSLVVCWRERDAEPAAGWVLAALVGAAVAHGFVHATIPALLVVWWLTGWCSAGRVEPLPGRRPAVGLAAALGVACALAVGAVAVRMARADLAFNLGLQTGSQAFRVEGEEGGTLLRASLRWMQDARAESAGARAAAVDREIGRLLEALYSRSTTAMRRGPEAAYWEGIASSATSAYRSALAVNPLDVYAWHDLARVLLEQSRALEGSRRQALVALALEASRRGCELDPFNAVLQADHARRLARSGKLGEAEAGFRRSLALHEGQPEVRRDLAQVLAEEGKREEAMAELQRVLREDPRTKGAEEALRNLSREPVPRKGER